jgi:hypothetical protein
VLTDRNESKIRHKWFDFKTPWQTPSNVPDYKNPTINHIKNDYVEGEGIIIISGGHGVSAVHSAHQVEPNGSVLVYEGSRDRVKYIKRTLKFNNSYDLSKVEHSIVGKAHKIESASEPNVIEPSELSECDVLELDCEGAELYILENLEISPKKIVVELHHGYSYSPYSSPDPISSTLEKKGYTVERINGRWVNELFIATLR